MGSQSAQRIVLAAVTLFQRWNLQGKNKIKFLGVVRS